MPLTCFFNAVVLFFFFVWVWRPEILHHTCGFGFVCFFGLGCFPILFLVWEEGLFGLVIMGYMLSGVGVGVHAYWQLQFTAL